MMPEADTDTQLDATLREVRPAFGTQRAVFALILREMSTTYGRSPGGYLWAILEPVAGIALLTAIFSAGFRSPPLGTSFAVFYATGMLPFLMYADITGKLTQTIPFSRALLEYPRVTFLDALMARFVLNALTQFMVHFLIAATLVIALDPNVGFELGKGLIAYAMVLALAFGIGTLNAFLVLAYPVWQNIWAILNRPMFLVSCIIFTFENVPRPWSDYLWWNPLIHPIGLLRDGIYTFYHPSYVSIAYPFAFAAVAGITGLFLLNRYHRDMLLK